MTWMFTATLIHVNLLLTSLPSTLPSRVHIILRMDEIFHLHALQRRTLVLFTMTSMEPIRHHIAF